MSSFKLGNIIINTEHALKIASYALSYKYSLFLSDFSVHYFQNYGILDTDIRDIDNFILYTDEFID